MIKGRLICEEWKRVYIDVKMKREKRIVEMWIDEGWKRDIYKHTHRWSREHKSVLVEKET